MQAQSIIPSDKTAIKGLPPKQQVRAMLEQNKSAIAKALPRHLSADRLLRVAQTACTTTPALLSCYKPSLVGAIIQCATMGLEPNTVLGHAYLVPFWNSNKRRKDVQVIVGYKGLVDLARRSGQIISVAAHAVYEQDAFDFEYGLEEKLSHRPARGDRGEMIAFYAVAKMKEGGHAFEVMWREEVDTIRDASQNAYRDDGKGRTPNKMSPWWNHYESMGRKTVLRRLAKYLPLSVEFATAITMEEVAESGKSQRLDTVLEGEYAPSFADEDDADIEQTPVVAAIDKPKINQRKGAESASRPPSNNGQGNSSAEASPLESNPDLVNAICRP